MTDRAALTRNYMDSLRDHNEMENKVKALRLKALDKRKMVDKTEDHIKA